MSKHTYTLLTEAHDLVASRVMNAPQALVFQAWSNPDHLAKWWGPNGFTNTFQAFDLRPGGDWKFIMHGPNGVNYPNHNRFLEIVEPERIVLEHLFEPHFQVTATFEALGEQTRVTFHQRFETAEMLDKVKGFAADANEQNLDRMEALLKSLLA